MRLDEGVTVDRMVDEDGRNAVIRILNETYRREKGWVADGAEQFPLVDLGREDLLWFCAKIDGSAVGVLRVRFDPSIAEIADSGLTLLAAAPDVGAFLKSSRIADIARFAVLSEFRGKFIVAAALMRAATEETVRRGYTHIVTEVLEDDQHNPFGFHTRVMGFYPVATQEVGELNSQSRRIILLLDIKAAYERLKARQNWIYRYMTGNWDEALHQRLLQ